MIAIGILLVIVAGLGTGSVAWPLKVARKFEFEHAWFVGMLVGLVMIPWTVTLLFCPDALGAYASLDPMVLVKSNLYAMGWGIANVLYGICVMRIGAALCGAILSGLGVCVGVTLPMVIKGTGLFESAPDLDSSAGLTVLAGVAMMLVGVVIVSVAGFGRERILNTQQGRTGGFLGGLIMCVIAGVLSCGISFAFVYSQEPVVAAMRARGAGEIPSNFAVWAAGLMGGALINLAYPAWVMTRKKNWHVLFRSNTKEVLLAACIGAQFIFAIALLGRGMVLLGALGASVGFGIQQAMQIMGNQGVGFISGEWKAVTGTPLRQMGMALVILILAAGIMAFGNFLAPV